MYLSFTEIHRDPRGFWTAGAYERLRRIKAAIDPHDLIRSNHPIPPQGTSTRSSGEGRDVAA